MTSHFGCISYSRSIQSFLWKDLKFALIIKTTRFYVCMLHLYSSSKMDSDPNLPVQHMFRTSLSPIYYLFLPFGNTLLQYYYKFRPVAVVSRQNSNPRSSSPSRFQSLQSHQSRYILKEEEEEQSHILCQRTRSISGNFLLWWFVIFTVKVCTVNYVQTKQHSIHIGTHDAVIRFLKGIY